MNARFECTPQSSTTILRYAISALLVCVATACSHQPQEPLAIINAESWGSRPQDIPGDRQHTIGQITIHHAGVLWKPGDDPMKKIKGLQSWGQRDKDWPDVPYHYLIAPDGRIFEGRNIRYAGETNTEYDPRGHALIQAWGNFEEQRVSTAQLRSMVKLAASLCQRFNLSPDTIKGHRDVSNQTSCPGKDLQRYITNGNITAWVQSQLRGEEIGIALSPPLPDGPEAIIPTGKDQ